MGADYYSADSEDGDRIEDPSEDALFMMLGDLDEAGNTFLVISPAAADAGWSVSVALLGKGVYEVVRRDSGRGERAVSRSAVIDDIARDLTRWLAARDAGRTAP
ncbi:hypothetical protein [Streptomyces sp. SPB074]|uniref:hypothetical protein n=1 Tax=Streptomyces sp. (strain SPB074) TaxID=465543 RepID=UPI00017F12D1|nr:hypothetical protein [Streptomyces sp. SPB074]